MAGTKRFGNYIHSFLLNLGNAFCISSPGLFYESGPSWKIPPHLRDYVMVNLGLKSVRCVFKKTMNLSFLEFSRAETSGAENRALQGVTRLPQNQKV